MRDDFYPPWQRVIVVAAFLLASLFAVTADANPVCMTAMGVTTCMDETGRVVKIAQERDTVTEEVALHIWHIVAASADLGITEHCLGARKCREVNALFGALVTDSGLLFGAVAGATTAAMAYFVHWLYANDHPKIARFAGIFAASVRTGAAVYNGYQLGAFK